MYPLPATTVNNRVKTAVETTVIWSQRSRRQKCRDAVYDSSHLSNDSPTKEFLSPGSVKNASAGAFNPNSAITKLKRLVHPRQKCVYC
mmetsp:Transcript_37046/g.110960  ORF Transcript_37046/g.110960 Transcript_37046/m.110960 type:complete len:88 (-) Transcript_37046:2451-2714(-)